MVKRKNRHMKNNSLPADQEQTQESVFPQAVEPSPDLFDEPCPHCSGTGKVPAKVAAYRKVALTILMFLNEKANRKYPAVAANLEQIVNRLKEGYTETQLRQVIARKCAEWKGDDWGDKYLRPATLFNRTKFANYVGELGRPIEPRAKR